MSKVLVIGLDGATLDLVDRWAKAGQLPVISGMMERGFSTPLRSVMPVLSSAAWSSFMTGVNPGKHGIYDFMRREQDSYRLRIVHREHNQAPSLWKLLSDNRRKVGVMNVPMTYPPEEVNGFLVSGLGTPEFKSFTYPTQLSKELLSRGYRVNKTHTFQPGNEAAYLEEVHANAKKQLEAALWLMQTEPWDFFMPVFFDTDQLAHFFWRHMDPEHPDHNPALDGKFANAIQDFYQALDRGIEQIIQAAGQDTTVMLVSDHGTGALYKDVFLNEWLRQEGYLKINDDDAQRSGLRGALARLGITRSQVSQMLHKAGLKKVEAMIKDLLGDRIEILPRTQRAEFPQAIDWSKTHAYSFGYQGQIYINLKGREPGGIVEPGEAYVQLCHEITTALFSLTDPEDGNPVVDAVYRREQVFAGPFLEYAPDLILVMRGLSYITRQGYEFQSSPGKDPGRIFAKPGTHESGSHRQDGLLIAAGARVHNLGRIQANVSLVDLAPTILALLDCPVPEEMDGKPRQDLFELEKIAWSKSSMTSRPDSSASPGTKRSVLSESEEREMIERLKSLGYLE